MAFLCLLPLLCMGCSRPVQVGEQVPDFEITDLHGKELSLKDLKGDIVVLHFWATWCAPCLSELPQLAALFGKSGMDRAVFLPVSTDQASSEHIRDFLDSWGFKLRVFQDPGGEVAGRYGTRKFPETYVIDGNGFLRRKIVGVGNWDDPGWVRYLQQLSGSGAEEH